MIGDSLGAGVGLAFFMHLGFVVLLGVVLAIVTMAAAQAPELRVGTAILLAPLLFIGLTQLLYLGPAIWWAWRSERRELAKGLGIGAVATLGLNLGLVLIVARM